MQNPKFIGTNIIDCIPQSGRCPCDCNQCFYNHPDFYTKTPIIPSVEEANGKIVRMNSGHDSNIQKLLVLQTASQYKDVFFNTSIPNFDFPGPVVYTANPNENEESLPLSQLMRLKHLDNLMFVRFRISAMNVVQVFQDMQKWIGQRVPIVLTFMRYYDYAPFEDGSEEDKEYHYRLDMDKNIPIYEYKKHIANNSWCPSETFIKNIMKSCYRMVYMCGTPTSSYCKDCGACEHFYWLTKKRLRI